MTSDPVGRTVILIGKPDCHLCDAARSIVTSVCDDVGADFHEVSILDSPELADVYAEYIPVVLIDGEQHDFWRIDADRLRRALS
ncbi:MAG: glutaredoxin family protein [Actinobacteria bacterium]|nr:glutaredoxin family protein [Actinomycetota bacterium]